MKILYLTDQTYLHGGIEKVLSQKANYFAEVTGDEVIIITYRQQGRDPVYQLSDKIRRIDIGISYENGKSYFHPQQLIKMPVHWRALRKVLRELQPDVVISCSFGPDFYIIPFAEKHIPKVKEFHSSRYFTHNAHGSLKTKILKWLTVAAEKRYDRLVVLNEDEKSFYKSVRVSIIPNPVERTAQKVRANVKNIMAAGRISPVKNFGDLITAFAAVCSEFPEWEIHFWGEDYLGTQRKLQQQIEELGLQSRIKFMGVTSNLKNQMENYSIYAMTSDTECFPMVLLESLSVGLPVISYDAPTGPKHILTHESDSYIVPDKNTAIFTTRLKQLMADENLRKQMGINAKENVERFEISSVMTLWRELFFELIHLSGSQNKINLTP